MLDEMLSVHITDHQDPKGEERYSSALSLTLALEVEGGKRHAPAALRPGRRQGTDCYNNKNNNYYYY
jgi:hypothetical protein